MEGSEFDVEADTIIAAVSQKPDFQGLDQIRNEDGWISTGEKNGLSRGMTWESIISPMI